MWYFTHLITFEYVGTCYCCRCPWCFIFGFLFWRPNNLEIKGFICSGQNNKISNKKKYVINSCRTLGFDLDSKGPEKQNKKQ